MKALLIFCFVFSLPVYGQGLFRELFAPGSSQELNLRHQQATSNWGSPYGILSKTDVDIFSDRFNCSEECGFKLHAGHELQRFSKEGAFGDTLEHPKFGGLVDVRFQKRILAELTISSPSNSPFDSIHETNVSFTGAFAPNEDLRTLKESYFIYFINYSNTRAFLPNIPLLGFSYTIPTEKGWTFSLGAPFLTVSYMEYPRLSFRASVGPFFYSTELGYGPPFFNYGISSSWRQDSYFIAERTRRDERFFLDQKDVSLFLRHPLSKDIILEWKASYFYGLGIRHGRSYSERTAPTEDLGTSAALSLNLKFKL